MRFATGLLLITCLAVFLPLGAHAEEVLWINASGGNWNDGANWNTGSAPSASDDVFITVPGFYTVTLDIAPTVASLTLGFGDGGQILRTLNWHLTVNGPIVIATGAELEATAASIACTGQQTITNNGTLDLDLAMVFHNVTNNGTILVERTCTFMQTVTNSLGGQITIAGTAAGNGTMVVDSGITNAGTIDLTSNYAPTTTIAALQISSMKDLTNTATGVINALLGSSFNTNSYREIRAQIQNSGVIHALGTGFLINKQNAVHTNSGSIIAEAGTTNFTQTGSVVQLTNTGTITTYPGATFQFQTGNFSWNSGTVTNNGTLAFTSANIYFTPKFVNPGRVTIGGISHVYLTDTVTNNGTIYQSGGFVHATGAIMNNDSLLYQTGTVECDVFNNGVVLANMSATFSGEFTTAVASKIVVQATSGSACQINFLSNLVNYADIELTQTGSNSAILSFLSADSLINAAQGIIRALPGTGGSAGLRSLEGRVHNLGTIEAASTFNISDNLEQHTNAGTIDIQNGVMTISGDFVSNGTINIAAGKTLSHSNHHFTFAGGDITGDGSIQLTNDTISVTGVTTNDARLWWMGLLNTMSADLFNTGILDVYGCTIGGSGLLTNRGVLNLTSATLNCALLNDGVIHAELTNSVPNFTTSGIDDSLFIIGTATGTATLTVGGSHINHGVLILTSDVANGTSTAILNATQFTNGATGMVFADAGSSTGGARQLNAQINNQGTITISSIGLSVNRASADHVNSGNIHVIGGELDFIQTGVTPSLTNNATIVLQNLQRLHIDGGDFINGTLGHIKGTGTLDFYAATTTNNGWISPGLPTDGFLPGRLTFATNTIDFGSDGKLWIEIGGTTPVTDYDQITVTQHAIMNGELRLRLIDGFLPAVGDSFRIINYDTYAGDFLYVESLTCNGIVFDTSYTDSCLWLHVTGIDNDPPTWTNVPDTVTFDNRDSSTYLAIWNYAYDNGQHDSTLTYMFVPDTNALYWDFTAAGFMYLYTVPNFTGIIHLTLVARDWHNAEAMDTVVLVVTSSVNTPPVFANVPDTITIPADTTMYLDIWGFVTDAESHDSLLTYTFSESNGALANDFYANTGLMSIAIDPQLHGTIWLYMTATDPGDSSATDSLVFNLIWNYPPVIVGLPDTMSFVTNQAPSLNMWTYAHDVELHDSVLSYQFTAGNDSVHTNYLAANGLLILSADAAYEGQTTLIVQVSDTGGKVDLDTIVLNVTVPVNEPPVFTGLPDTLTIASDSVHSLNIWDYASDPESADNLLTFSFASLGGPGIGWTFTSANGAMTIFSNSFVGTRGLICRVDDPQALSAYDTITIVVVAANDPPEFVELPAALSFHVDSACTLMLWDYVTDDQTTHAMMGVNFTRSNDSLLLNFLSVPGQLTLTATAGYSGSSSLIIRVTDEGFLMAYDTIDITVTETPNDPPQFVGLPDTLGFDANDTRVIQLWDYVTDDHSPHAMMGVQFTRTNDSLLFDFLSVPGTLELSAEAGYAGTSLLIIRVNDEAFLMAYDTIEVTIFPPLGIVDANGDGLPDRYELSQNYPNPFNPSTSIRFALPEAATVDLAVYNILGQRVATLVSGAHAAGLHETSWNGRDQSNQPVTSGVYFYRLTAGDETIRTRKMLLLQ